MTFTHEMDDRRAELVNRYPTQRRVIVIGAAGLILTICILGLSAWLWAQPGIAQSVATPVPGSTSNESNAQLVGRIEELSRSQDRLVDATIGIITVVGAGFALLIGFSAFQTNRNADREAAFIRDSAEWKSQRR
jgi:hypothetical protein